MAGSAKDAWRRQTAQESIASNLSSSRTTILNRDFPNRLARGVYLNYNSTVLISRPFRTDRLEACSWIAVWMSGLEDLEEFLCHGRHNSSSL
jgi:hypothetical protein